MSLLISTTAVMRVRQKLEGWRAASVTFIYLLLFLIGFEGVRRAIVVASFLPLAGEFGDQLLERIALAAVLGVCGLVCSVFFLLSYATWPSSRASAVLAVSLGLYFWTVGLLVNLGLTLYLIPRHVAALATTFTGVPLVVGDVLSVLFCGALLFICVGMLRRFRRSAPGVRVTKEAQPRLWQVFEETASRCGVVLPAHIYWLPIANAEVTLKGSWFGIKGEPALGIGLPLLRVLGVDELRATLAHEFQHLRRGDISTFACIYGARRDAESIRDGFAPIEGLLGLTMRFIEIYPRFIWQLSRPVVREWEFEADSFSAQSISPGSMARALVKCELAQLRFDAFRKSWVEPALESGYLPPVIEGFWEYYEECALDDRNQRRLIAAREANRENASHPPLRERLLRISQFGGTAVPQWDGPAYALVDQPQFVEAELYDAGKRAVRQNIWTVDVLQKLMEQWRRQVLSATQRRRGGVKLTSLRSLLASMPGTAEFLGYEKRASSTAERLLLKAFASSLADAGWEPALRRGRLLFSKNKMVLDPAAEILGLKTKQFEDWDEHCAMLGVADLVLIPESEPPSRKLCQRCIRAIDSSARRCPHCGKVSSSA